MQVIVITTWLVSIMILALDLYIKGELEKEILNTTRMDFAFKLVPAVIGMVLVAPFLVSALFLGRLVFWFWD